MTYPRHSFLLETGSTPEPYASGWIKLMKNSSGLIGNRTCELVVCSAVPQTTVQLRALFPQLRSMLLHTYIYIYIYIGLSSAVVLQDFSIIILYVLLPLPVRDTFSENLITYLMTLRKYSEDNELSLIIILFLIHRPQWTFHIVQCSCVYGSY